MADMTLQTPHISAAHFFFFNCYIFFTHLFAISDFIAYFLTKWQFSEEQMNVNAEKI